MPETVTTEELLDPIDAKVIRFSPEVWSGVPFMHVTLNYCASDQDLSQDQLSRESG